MLTASRPLGRLFLHLSLVVALVLQGSTALAMRGAHTAPQAIAAAAVDADAAPPCHVTGTSAADHSTPSGAQPMCCEGGLAGLCQWACSMAMTPLAPAALLVTAIAPSPIPTAPSVGFSGRVERVPLRPPIS